MKRRNHLQEQRIRAHCHEAREAGTRKLWWAGAAAVLLLAVCLGSFSCSGKNVKQEENVAEEAPWYEKSSEDTPLETAYTGIVFGDFTINPDLASDYPGVAGECLTNAISWLNERKAFPKIERETAGRTSQGAELLVKANVADMRIVSGGARFWVGAMAGNSYLNMDVLLLDAASGKEVRKKTLTSSNNAFAAAYSMGSTDRSLPSDMGRMLAEYLIAVVPGQTAAVPE